MQNKIEKFEYDIIIKSCKYYQYVYSINDIDFDFILSKCILLFEKNKVENKIKAYSKDYTLDNKKLYLNSFIKVMCENVTLDFIKSKKIKTITFSELETKNNNDTNFIDILSNYNDAFDEIIKEDLVCKISYLYSILTEKEQMLCDLLSTIDKRTNKCYSKYKICKLLCISTNEYNSYILKIKKLLMIILENNYKGGANE